MAVYKIGEVTALSDLSADTLRYYEKIGLLPNVSRSSFGVRQYDDKDLSRLNFIKRAQRVTFTLEDINHLLTMREDPQHAKAEIRELTAKKLADVEKHLKDLSALRNELALLLNLCRGSEDGCPIIEDIDSQNEIN
ncbi:MAG: MerR family DNA-binding protein [Gammaproteobacteria bacterium]|nr:MerR family DNA-binding protein [Gammaproteobacteria bacterium]